MKFVISAILLTALPLAADVAITKGENKISVSIDGKPYTEFFYGPDVMHPYLYPLRSAAGTLVTRHYPMEKVEGESTDHIHHRGLWVAHSSVNGLDFWNSDPSYTTPNRGKIVVKQIEKIESGKNSGYIQVTMEWQTLEGKPLMVEKRKMIFYSGKEDASGKPDRVMDLDIMLTPVTPVTFGDNKDGVFAIRLAAGLEEPQKKAPASPARTGVMVSADGCKTEKECWGKRSNWMDDYGEVDGEKVGVAILDHPTNPRHPTYWHTRAYGLFAANIFGTKDFTHDKTQDGAMTVEIGQPLRFRYRVIIHAGDPETAGIATEYKKYVE